MAKQQMQKTKLLELYDYFKTYTDEEHGVGIDDIISHLASLGISAERKSVYSDIEALISWGADIIQKREGRKSVYFLASRDFETAELKMLVDIIGASRFVTAKKSQQLIQKIGTLCSVYDAKKLSRQVKLAGRVKTANEIIYLNVDKIHTSFNEERLISFRYFSHDSQKKKVYRREGREYVVVPLTLLWNNDNYYLVAHDLEKKAERHFRVDKMENVELLGKKNEKERALCEKFDSAKLSKRVFDMFAGVPERVELRVNSGLVSNMFDRFGEDIVLRHSEGDSFEFTVDVELSPSFYAWLSNFEGQVKIIAPRSAVDAHREHVEKIMNSLEK